MREHVPAPASISHPPGVLVVKGTSRSSRMRRGTGGGEGEGKGDESSGCGGQKRTSIIGRPTFVPVLPAVPVSRENAAGDF